MLVGVMSDSHDAIRNVETAVNVFKREGVDVVIHLGDIVAPFTLARIASSLAGARVEAVFGNNCGEKPLLIETARRFDVNIGDPPRVVNVGGRKLLLVHGFGSPEQTVELVEALALSGKWDGVLYGHTHKPDYRYVQGRLILNPGEVAGVFGKPTVALLDTDTLRARIVELG